MKLAPYNHYQSKPTAESRQAIARQIINPTAESDELIGKGLVEVISVEGPILSTRAFTLYARKGGLTKLTPPAIRRFSIALKKMIDGKQIMFEPDTKDKKSQALLWLPTMDRVKIRAYGNRGFDDIPTSELGEVMLELFMEEDANKEELFQKLISLYELKQFPKNATTRLDYVYDEYID